MSVDLIGFLEQRLEVFLDALPLLLFVLLLSLPQLNIKSRNINCQPFVLNHKNKNYQEIVKKMQIARSPNLTNHPYLKA